MDATENAGPVALVWTRNALSITDELPPEAEPPTAVWKASPEDGGRLEAIVWGDGSLSTLLAVTVRYRGPEGGPSRFPTWPEIYSALVAASKPGTVFATQPLTIHPEMAPRAEEAAQAGEWLGVPLVRTGVAKGSPAESNIILSPGGLAHGRPN